MQKYLLILVYKPSITKEQVDEHVLTKITNIFKDFKLEKPKYKYAGNKLFAYLIRKHKSGHFALLSFDCEDVTQKKTITQLQKKINESSDVIRAISFKNSNREHTIESLCKMDINIDSRELYL